MFYYFCSKMITHSPMTALPFTQKELSLTQTNYKNGTKHMRQRPHNPIKDIWVVVRSDPEPEDPRFCPQTGCSVTRLTAPFSVCLGWKKSVENKLGWSVWGSWQWCWCSHFKCCLLTLNITVWACVCLGANHLQSSTSPHCEPVHFFHSHVFVSSSHFFHSLTVQTGNTSR